MTASTGSPAIPERLVGLTAIAKNLFWSWQRDARALFRSIDMPLWRLTRHNPIALLQQVDPARLESCARHPDFLRLYDAVFEAFIQGTSATGGWFEHEYPDLRSRSLAYFCAEFALHNSVPIYSGGLGVLAGDHCKAASDLGVPAVGVGLLYTRGYFDQRLRLDGWQDDAPELFDPSTTPLTPVFGENGDPSLATVTIAGRVVHVGAWRMMVGRVPVYLLDTDLELNTPDDRQLSHKLYAGGPDLRLRQEAILGIGGVRVLRHLDIEPAAWHANEGHAALMMLERIREAMECGKSVAEAVAAVRGRSVFTTHTPVPAGHDIFPPDLFQSVMGDYMREFGTHAQALLELGRHPGMDHEKFHMTALAIRLSAKVSGVSRAHAGVTRDMWRVLWQDRPASSVPIGHVTNGVHLTSWMAHRFQELLDSHLGRGWESDDTALDQLATLDDAALWSVHVALKAELMDFIRAEARARWRDRWQDAAHVVGAGTLLDGSAMTLGFARRFAGYKRASLVLRDPERLRNILVHPQRPVQLVFAGKAHPADDIGKRILQEVASFTKDRRFEGRVAFLEDYELHLAHRLIQGVDLWISLPRPPLEACGTSGMKAALNGVPQLSTDDGWWAEAQTGLNGWTIHSTPGVTDEDAGHADQLYSLLENEIVPLFYDRDGSGIPVRWTARMKHAMMTAARHFTARRMVRQYVRDYYVPAMQGGPPDHDPPAGTAAPES